ncbi:hypothetical protein DH2020_028701 [Rehmannia glutinosa]|uniref:DUF4378 domain-containing protein n=1 Tax=Rehmannia glutinosa TaxID=99300 RepID=A0ABR0VRM3_REHGL
MDSSLIRRPIRAFSKPLLLKDHLLDDMSSCSSNGFKSFPRRQCCTSVRFLHEFEYRNKNKQQRQQQKRYSNFNRTASKSAISAIQSVITAVKRLPFAAAKSAEKRRFKDSFLARSFSRKILKKSGFWNRKTEQKEIGRWKSFDQLLKEDAEPSSRSDGSITARDGKSNSWSESDFTASDDCSSGNSSSEVNSNLPEERNDVVQVPVKVVSSGNGVGVTTNGDVSTVSTTECSANTNSSTNSQQKQWSSEEKEQFSPVSVLDCPFDDEDEVSSAFQHRLARMEGAKMKLMKKIQRFECLAKLEPINLATQFALQSDSDMDEKSISDIEDEEEEEENEDENKALELLHQMKATLPSYSPKLKPDKLLLDFFRERVTDESSFDEGLLEEADDWINGRKSRELFVEWEVQGNRKAYIKDMEKGGEWKTLEQESDEVALELETVVFDELLNEVLLEISS